MRQFRFTFVQLVIFCLLFQAIFVSAKTNALSDEKSPVIDGNPIIPNEDKWKAFRDTFPFHIQTLAFDKESRLLIISEPPPHITLKSVREAIQQYNPTIDPRMDIKSNSIGVDGWVKDILVQLPPMTGAQTQEAIDAIQQHVFFTTYKSYVMSLPVDRPVLHSDNLDLNVSSAEIKKWLFEDNETFSPLMGGASQTANDLLINNRAGVFFSKDRGLVIWSINRTKPFSESLIEARQFALDSDIIVSAVNAGNKMLIIGRERIVPVDIMPPLRTETILQLASVKDSELAQSYERNNIFAGKFNDANEDWAPIYLSDSLKDTEYGSLLNVTDQLLKRWSMNGFIDYKNFEKYPDPSLHGKKWCFNRPLYLEAGATRLTFNWNTQGVGYTTQIGDRQFFALNRSGSLPTSYLEGENQKPNYTNYEETGYQCFATFGDPNLARVVQYAALYQVFQKFPVGANVYQLVKKDRPGSSNDVLIKEALRIIKLLVDPNPKQIENLNKSLSPTAQLVLQYHQLIFKEIQSKFGDEGLFELARRITYPQPTAQEIEHVQNLQEKIRKLSPQQKLLLEYGLLADKEFQKDVQNLIRFFAILDAIKELSKVPSSTKYLFGEIESKSLNSLKEQYSRQFVANENNWVHTPSIVVSTPKGEVAELSGGHNIDAETTSFKTSATVPRGSTKTIRNGSRLTVLVHPEDVAKIPSLVRRTAFLAKQVRAGVQTDLAFNRSLQRFMRGVPPPRPPRAINTAFQMPSDPPSYRGFEVGNNGGWQVVDGSIPTPKYKDVAVSVHKQPTADGLEYTLTTAEGIVIKANSTPSAIDSIVSLGRNAVTENPQVKFRLNGFTEDEAHGFLYNAGLRLKNNELAGFVEPQKIPVNKAAEYNLPGVNVGEHSLRTITDGFYKGNHELTINFDVPPVALTKPGLKVRLQMLYKNTISDPTISGVKSAIKNFFAKPISGDPEMNVIITDLANELRKTNKDMKNILTVWKQDSSGILVVELLPVQKNDKNPGQNSKAE